MSLTVLSIGYPLAPVAESTAGGAEQILAILDEALVAAGHHSLVIAPKGSVCHGKLLVTTLPDGPLDDAARARVHREYRAVIQSALRDHPVDIVHMHGIDFLKYLPNTDLPIVVTLHLPLSWYSSEAFLLHRPNVHMICVSESQKIEGPSTASSCQVIHNGVRVDRFQLAREKGNYAVALGRICPEKGYHLALDAASQAGIPLILAGQVFGYKAHEEYFETMIRPRLTGQHRFIGAVGGRRKNQLLSGAQCVVVPSLVAETSSLVAMEALACGTPVVAFRRGALAEIVEQGGTGFLVDTPAQMAEAIKETARLSASFCREHAERRFSSTQMIRNYFSLYGELTSRSRVTAPDWQEVAG